MKKSGFVKNDAIGFVFPGVDVTSLNMKNENKVDEDADPPRMTIDPISSNGTIVAHFDQDMMVPNYIDYKIYRKVLRLIYKRNTDNQISEGRFVKLQ